MTADRYDKIKIVTFFEAMYYIQIDKIDISCSTTFSRMYFKNLQQHVRVMPFVKMSDDSALTCTCIQFIVWCSKGFLVLLVNWITNISH